MIEPNTNIFLLVICWIQNKFKPNYKNEEQQKIISKYVSIFNVCCFDYFALFLDGFSFEPSNKKHWVLIKGRSQTRLLEASSSRSFISAYLEIPDPKVEIRANCYQLHCLNLPTRCLCKCLLEIHFLQRPYNQRELPIPSIMRKCFESSGNIKSLFNFTVIFVCPFETNYRCTLSLFCQWIMCPWRFGAPILAAHLRVPSEAKMFFFLQGGG